jgi:steroid 5-alpha reductase family enzyme
VTLSAAAMIALLALGVVTACGVFLWGLSLALRNSAIVDVAWGPFFFLVAAVERALGHGAGLRGTLVLVLLGCWAARLSIHLIARGGFAHEDRRYAAMRARFGQRWWIVSLPVVFLLQPALAWFVGAPVQAALLRPQTPLGWSDGLGTAVVVVGLSFEAAADAQLSRFRSRAGSGVLDTGLWRYSRHPNYFGDFLVWWGFGLFGFAAGVPWTLAGPLVMSFLLLRVSGVTLLEQTIVDRRPEYAAYQRRTNAFFPGPPRGR